MKRKGLFRGEGSLTWLLEQSQRARDVLSGQLEGFDYPSKILDWRRPDKPRLLGNDLKCPEEEVCQKLIEKIRQAWNIPPRNFVKSDLESLFHGYMSEALCRELRIRDLDELFDSVQIQKLLHEVGASSSLINSTDVQNLLIAVLDPKNLVEAKKGLRPQNWGPVVERWFQPEMVPVLNEAVSGWTTGKMTSACALASLMDHIAKVSQPSGLAEEFRFDSIAICYLQQRVNHAADDIARQAVELAENAAHDTEGSSAISNLAGCIHAEQGSIAKSLRHFLSPRNKMRLSDFFDPSQFEAVACVDQPDAAKPLVVSDAAPNPAPPLKKDASFWMRARARFMRSAEIQTSVSFDVACWMEGAQEPKPILRCRLLTPEDAELLRAEISNLKGADLCRGGGTLSECLLQNRITVAKDPQLKRALKAIGTLVPEIAQTLVLCGTPLPVVGNAPWAEDFKFERPYRPLSLSVDSCFPRNAQAIAEERRSEAERDGQQVSLLSEPA